MGSTCARRSRQPRSPKSGDTDDHAAPSDVAASIAAAAPASFATTPATRSPGPTPSAARPARSRPTSSRSAPYVVSTGAADRSVYDSRARFSSGLCGPSSRSSAWLTAASGNQSTAPGGPESRHGTAPRASRSRGPSDPGRRTASKTARQNCRGSLTLRACSRS